MSLWTRFRDTAIRVGATALGTAVGGPALGAIAGGLAGGRGTVAGSMPSRLPSIPGVGTGQISFPSQSFIGPAAGAAIRIGGRVLKSPAVRAGAAAAAGAILGEELFDGSGRPAGVRRKYRRMNPCNPKALRRAVRRLSAYHKQNKKIEAQLRKLAPPRRARSAPRQRYYSPPHK